MSTLGINRRDFPQFDASEVTVGDLLGIGGFSSVKEVSNISVDDHEKEEDSNKERNMADEKAEISPSDALGADHEQHYEVSTARAFMSKYCRRLGSARYAIKRLKPELDQVQRARGSLDLAIEIKYLRVFWHPNIGKSNMEGEMRNVCSGKYKPNLKLFSVKMRGISNTDAISERTFM
jgi:hypothetical protein